MSGEMKWAVLFSGVLAILQLSETVSWGWVIVFLPIILEITWIILRLAVAGAFLIHVILSDPNMRKALEEQGMEIPDYYKRD